MPLSILPPVTEKWQVMSITNGTSSFGTKTSRKNHKEVKNERSTKKQPARLTLTFQ